MVFLLMIKIIMTFSEQLLTWFEQYGRKNLPWQQQPNPYHVWLSEIMLQQTQVNTVIPYYLRFTKHYPTLSSLANAPLDDILALWTGLGYYARARNLHKTANIVVKDYHGELPSNLEQLITLPGIGRSTAGAIMALAYHQRYSILDGNVKRVLTRYKKISGWPGNKTIEKQLWDIAEQLLPKTHFANYIQAQMDLGTLICTRSKPKCELCPLQADCQAFQHGIPQNYPETKPKKIIPTRHSYWLVMQNNDGKILLQQRPPSGIWGGLWSFPEAESLENIAILCAEKFHVNIKEIISQPSFKHVFSHFKLTIHPQLITVKAMPNKLGERNSISWYNINDALRLGLATPVKNFLQSLSNIEELMVNTVHCVKLQREADGLDFPPYPGELGKKIYESVSKEGWQLWLGQQTMLINENRLSLADPKSQQFLKEELKKFFFGEGSAPPADFVAK